MFVRSVLFVASFTLLALLAAHSSKSALSSRGILVVANQKEHTVLLVDPEARRELAKISVGVNGHEVAVSPDSRFAYVPSTAIPESASPAPTAPPSMSST